jgi:hypothetical protein
MTLLQLHSKLEELMQKGWLDEEVRVLSNNGNRLNVEIVAISTIDPPAPRPAPEVHILVED